MLLRVRGFRLRVARTVPNSPRPGSRLAMPDKLYPVTGGGVEAAEMVKVEDDALDPGEIVVGLKTQDRPAGAVQESAIGPLNPPTTLAPIIRLADPPGATVTLWAERLREKPGPATAAAGTRLAKTLVVLPPLGKLGWLPPPAVR